jgi:hypothetical protein
MKLFLNILSLLPLIAFSQLGGRGVYDFQNISYSAYSTSMGGQLLSDGSNDLQLIGQNPALLINDSIGEFSMNYTNYIADISGSQLLYNLKKVKSGNLAFGLTYLNYGSFIETSAGGVQAGTFSANDFAFSSYYAQYLDKDSMYSVGTESRIMFSQLESYLSLGVALDFGFNYFNKQSDFGYALVVDNIGYQFVKYDGVREIVYPRIHFGLRKGLAHAPFDFVITAHDLQRPNLNYTDIIDEENTIDPLSGETIEGTKNYSDLIMRHLNLGVIFNPIRNFNVRFGYNYQRQRELRLVSKTGGAGFTFGIGIKIKEFYIDYGQGKYSAAGTNNQFTITRKF